MLFADDTDDIVEHTVNTARQHLKYFSVRSKMTCFTSATFKSEILNRGASRPVTREKRNLNRVQETTPNTGGLWVEADRCRCLGASHSESCSQTQRSPTQHSASGPRGQFVVTLRTTSCPVEAELSGALFERQTTSCFLSYILQLIRSPCYHCTC